MTTRARGIDISHYQKEYTPQSKHDFVIIKCSDGKFKNSLYDQHYQAAFESGKLVGAYHYLRSGFQWQEQVVAFAEYARGAHFLAVDFEKKGNVFSTEFITSTFEMIYGLVKAHKGKKRVLFYSSPAVIQEWLFQNGITWLRDYEDLWIAQWPYKGWNNRLNEVPNEKMGWFPRLPAGCNHWRVWQYAGDGDLQGQYNGVPSRDVDLDIFNGTVREMKEWVGMTDYKEEENDWNKLIELMKERLDELKDER